MDREYGAQDALALVRRADFPASSLAFDAAMQRDAAETAEWPPRSVVRRSVMQYQRTDGVRRRSHAVLGIEDPKHLLSRRG